MNGATAATAKCTARTVITGISAKSEFDYQKLEQAGHALGSVYAVYQGATGSFPATGGPGTVFASLREKFSSPVRHGRIASAYELRSRTRGDAADVGTRSRIPLLE